MCLKLYINYLILYSQYIKQQKKHIIFPSTELVYDKTPNIKKKSGGSVVF